jgi:antitoxin YefM
MEAITYTKARKNFSETMNKVCQDHAPLIITRQNEDPVVMMSLEDYNAIEETLYLFNSPKNAARLSKALIEIGQKKFTEKRLLKK